MKVGHNIGDLILPYLDTQQETITKKKGLKNKLSDFIKFQVELVSRDFFSKMPKTIQDGSYRDKKIHLPIQ